MNCIGCNKQRASLMCDDCKSSKVCKRCFELKPIKDFYKYKKDGKVYSTCKECFNTKKGCELCGKEFNKTYLKKHI